MPRDGSLTPADLIGKLDVLRIECEKCGRRGGLAENFLVLTVLDRPIYYCLPARRVALTPHFGEVEISTVSTVFVGIHSSPIRRRHWMAAASGTAA